ncbi:hypothetical protein Agub_g14840, partial [Astrephomene gubernaculifera]
SLAQAAYASAWILQEQQQQQEEEEAEEQGHQQQQQEEEEEHVVAGLDLRHREAESAGGRSSLGASASLPAVAVRAGRGVAGVDAGLQSSLDRFVKGLQYKSGLSLETRYKGFGADRLI